MGVINTYTDDTATTGTDKLLTVNTDGSTVLTPVDTLRDYLFPVAPLSAEIGWNNVPTAPNTVTNNGQHSETLVFNGVDYTNLMNPGTRIRTTRTVLAPVQCTSLNGTTQYWSKATPNKMTFTDDFVVDAWVKLSSHAAAATIVSRYNGTSGWTLELGSAGQVFLYGFNGGSGNVSWVQSYQSLPLNKWVHITAQLDMSAFTATSTTSYVMFDGIDVPSAVSRMGTNPTALIQAGNLEVGSQNSGTKFFPGKIAQAAVFSAKVTQAQILTYHSQGYLGTETSLISACAFNGTAVDLMTTTPNNLTASGSAGYVADSPFGTQASGLISSTLDYGIVQSATFSTNTTVVVQVPEGCTIPTSGGVSAVSYSGLKAPYGFPGQKGKWDVDYIQQSSTAITSAVGGIWYNPGSTQILAPVGCWDASYQVAIYALKGAGTVDAFTTLSLTNSTQTDIRWSTWSYVTGSITELVAVLMRRGVINATVATPYYLNTKVTVTSTNLTYQSSSSPLIITLTNAYL